MSDRYDPIETEPETLYEVFVQFFHDETDDLDASHDCARRLIGVLRTELRLELVQVWKGHRIALCEREEQGRHVDWSDSDDEAASLLSFILDQLQ